MDVGEDPVPREVDRIRAVEDPDPDGQDEDRHRDEVETPDDAPEAGRCHSHARTSHATSPPRWARRNRAVAGDHATDASGCSRATPARALEAAIAGRTARRRC